jgi:hypothetical protein
MVAPSSMDRSSEAWIWLPKQVTRMRRQVTVCNGLQRMVTLLSSMMVEQQTLGTKTGTGDRRRRYQSKLEDYDKRSECLSPFVAVPQILRELPFAITFTTSRFSHAYMD